MLQGGKHDLGRKWQRCDDGPWRQRAIIRTVRHASSDVSKEAPRDSSDPARRRSRAVARGDAPSVLTVVAEALRIANAVLLVHIGRATAVLKVVKRLSAHEGILDAAKVNPHVRELMHEQRGAVEKFVAVQLLPAIGRRPREIALRGQGVRWRAEAEHVQDQRLVISLPAIAQEAGFRLPSMRHGGPTVLRPSPVHAPVQRVGELPHLTFSVCIPIEIGGGGQRASDEDGRIDRRQLGTPRAPASRDIEEMIEEAPMTSCVWRRPLRSLPEEAQRGQRTLDGLCAGHERALDRYRIAGKCESNTGNAGRDVVG